MARWQRARILVEIPFFHRQDLTPYFKEEVKLALSVRFRNNKYKLNKQVGNIQVKSFLHYHKSLPPDVTLVEIKDDLGASEQGE